MSVAITIRNVPEAVRDELAARARRSGRSMQEYLLEELRATSRRPDLNDVIDRARARSRTSHITAEDILAARDADRR